jgi:hypothetical protein
MRRLILTLALLAITTPPARADWWTTTNLQLQVPAAPSGWVQVSVDWWVYYDRGRPCWGWSRGACHAWDARGQAWRPSPPHRPGRR